MECGDNYAKWRLFPNRLLQIQTQRKLLSHYLSWFELGIHVIVLTHSNMTHLANNRDTPGTEMSVSPHALSLQQFLL